MSQEEIFKEAAESILNHDKNKAEEVAKRALTLGINPLDMITRGFREGIIQVGDLFGRGEIFMPELLDAAEAMKTANTILTAAMPEGTQQKKGKVVIGTVQGYSRHRETPGRFAPPGQRIRRLRPRTRRDREFIEIAQEIDADIIGTSALLTTTMTGQKTRGGTWKAGLKDRLQTMVGGAP
jgi:trimethylamine corrinoid protein